MEKDHFIHQAAALHGRLIESFSPGALGRILAENSLGREIASLRHQLGRNEKARAGIRGQKIGYVEVMDEAWRDDESHLTQRIEILLDMLEPNRRVDE